LEGKKKMPVSDRELDEIFNPVQQVLVFPSEASGKK
jgi:hypothetical protein